MMNQSGLFPHFDHLISQCRRNGECHDLLYSRQLSHSLSRMCRRAIIESRFCNIQLSSQIEIKSSHTAPVRCLSLHNVVDNYLLCAGMDGAVSLYDLMSADDGNYGKVKEIFAKKVDSARGRLNQLARSSGPNYSPIFSPLFHVQWYPSDTDLFIAATCDGALQVWDTNSFRVVSSFQMPDGPLNAASINGK